MEKRPVERGSSPRELKKARRSIMKQAGIGAQREPTQRFDVKKSRVSFGGDAIKFFGRDSSENSNGTLEVTSTETINFAPVSRETENKENIVNNTLDLLDSTQQQTVPDFSFEIDNSDPRRNSLQTQNIFTNGITMTQQSAGPQLLDESDIKKSDSVESFLKHESEIAEQSIPSPFSPNVTQSKSVRLEMVAPSPLIQSKPVTSEDLPPITPISEPRKKRRSLLETVQRNNLIRQQSPNVKTPTRTIPKPMKQLVPSSEAPEIGKKKAKLLSMFKFPDDEEESDDETISETEVMSRENQTIRGDVTLNLTGNQTMNQTCRMDKTVLGDQTMAMDMTMNQTAMVDDKSGETTAKVFSKLKILDSKLSKKPKKPAGLPIPTQSPASEPIPDDSPQYHSPVQLSDNDLERITANFKREQMKQLQLEPPASPFTPNRAQTSLRKKLMKSRESIGLAKAKRLHGQDIMRSPAPDSPITRSRSKISKLNSDIQKMEDSPVTRSIKKKVVTMQEEKSQFILPPVTPVSKKDQPTNSGLAATNLPEISGIAQLTNTSITDFNINNISTENFIQGDQESIKFDSDIESLNATPEPSVYLQNVTVDNPATKLVSLSTNVTLKSEKIEDSFDYTRALELATTRIVPAEFTDPINDEKMQTKNEEFSSFITTIQGLFGSNQEVDFKNAETEEKLAMPFSRHQWRGCKLDEIFVNQMKDLVNKIRPTEIECHQIAKYNEDQAQKIDLEAMRKATVNLAHHKYLSELIKMTKAKCTPDKRIEELSGNVLET